MDHLPQFKHSEPFPKVPYLCKEEYDGLSFCDYPARKNIDLERIKTRDFSQRAPEEMACFLQNWLFFGLLTEFFGGIMPVDHEYWTTEGEGEDGQVYVQTEHLNWCIELWANWRSEHRIVDQPDEEFEKFVNAIRKCLDHASAVSRSLLAAEPIATSVILSFIILGTTIEGILKWHCEIDFGTDWGTQRLAHDTMKRRGWCIRDIALAERFTSFPLPMLIAMWMSRKQTGDNHSRCSYGVCLANQIDEKKYHSKHRTPGCNCEYRGPSVEELKRIVRKGGIPIIRLATTTTTNGSRFLDIRVKERSIVTTSNEFIAISHVWSDGLGNPKNNSLPQCQLLWLHETLAGAYLSSIDEELQRQRELLDENEIGETATKIISTLHDKVNPWASRLRRRFDKLRGDPVYLWLDTLCVPLDRDYRKMAIKELKKVYSWAALTVVLDAELQEVSTQCGAEELLMRIAFSAWMRRAWTFQEAVLSDNRLRVRFKDGLVDLYNLLDADIFIISSAWHFRFPAVVGFQQKFLRWAQQRESSDQRKRREKIEERREYFTAAEMMRIYAGLVFLPIRSVWSLAADVSDKVARVSRILQVWEGMRWRSTSRTDDKLVVFATACIMSAQEMGFIAQLVDLPAPDRMQRWIEEQPAVPGGFLFADGPKLQTSGFRWVPSRISQSALEDHTIIDRTSGDRELRIKKLGFILPSNWIPSFPFTHQSEGENQRYHIDLDSHDCAPWHAQPGSYALILQAGIGYGKAGTGVLVLVNSLEGDDAIRCKFSYRVNVQHIGALDGCDIESETLQEHGTLTWLVG